MASRHHLRVSSVLLATALASGWAVAQTGGATHPNSSMASPAAAAPEGTIASADRKFMENAARSGMFEMQAGQLAESRSSDAAVRNLASQLVQDRQQSNNELMQLASTRHVDLPSAPTRSQRRTIDKLSKLNGAAFDDTFVSEVAIGDREKDIRAVQKAADQAQDPELKAWAQKMLPQMREQLSVAQALPEAGKTAAAMGNRGRTEQPGGGGGY